jgi:hypothetical protein
MPRGYAEGPAADAAEARLDEIERGDRRPPPVEQRTAVYGSTEDAPERHFLGWLGEIDPDELFESGQAWGLSLVRSQSG